MTRGKLNGNRISNYFINRNFIQCYRNNGGKGQRTATGEHDTNMRYVGVNLSSDGDMAMMIKTIKFTLHPSRIRKGKTESTAPIARSEYAQLYFHKGAGWDERKTD